MSDTIKIIVEILKDDFKKLVNPYQHNEIWCERLKRIVIHGIPLNDVKAKIAEEICLTDNPYTKETKYTIEHLKLLEILDNIGKVESEDFPQAKDIEPTIKNFSKVLDNKLISNAIPEERCWVCGGVKLFGICQDCGSSM